VRRVELKLKKMDMVFCKCQHKNVGFMENKYVRKMTFLFSIFFNFPQSNIASGL
jgi:hypothetical protein